MSLHFRSLRSSSSANCLLLWSKTTTLMFDMGIKTQFECRSLLSHHCPRGLDALIVSHAHTDHVGYPALKTLAGCPTPIYAESHTVRHLKSRHTPESWKAAPILKRFPSSRFTIGDIDIEPIELPHDPDVVTHGFVVTHDSTKAVLCTDFHDSSGVFDHFLDADFIFLESNHDPHLLRLHPNYASRWHLSNPKAASLLYHVTMKSRRPARTVMLGHLSKQRNTPSLAKKCITDVFAKENADIPFDLHTAPPHDPSVTVEISPHTGAHFPRHLFDEPVASL